MPTIPELLFPDGVPEPEWVAEKVLMLIVPDEPEDETEPMPEPEVYDMLTGETEPLSEHIGIDLGERARVGDTTTGGTDAPGDDADDDEPDSLAEAIRRVKENDT